MRKSYIEKRFSCKTSELARILLELGYVRDRNNFYKKTSVGRIHIKLDSMSKDSCKIVIHHDLSARKGHYTTVFDPYPSRAWKQIKDKLSSIYGKNVEK